MSACPILLCACVCARSHEDPILFVVIFTCCCVLTEVSDTTIITMCLVLVMRNVKFFGPIISQMMDVFMLPFYH